jgi:hypothetical protein
MDFVQYAADEAGHLQRIILLSLAAADTPGASSTTVLTAHRHASKATVAQSHLARRGRQAAQPEGLHLSSPEALDAINKFVARLTSRRPARSCSRAGACTCTGFSNAKLTLAEWRRTPRVSRPKRSGSGSSATPGSPPTQRACCASPGPSTTRSAGQPAPREAGAPRPDGLRLRDDLAGLGRAQGAGGAPLPPR